jgi:D-xylose transport system ATP-binding protein
MIGREIGDFYPEEQTVPQGVSLSIEGYSVRHPSFADQDLVKDVTMHFRSGEIVGISGLLGAGRTELMSALVGGYKTPGRGRVAIDGKQVSIKNPRQAIRHGIGYVTEDRKGNGLILKQTIRFNISLASLDGIKKGFVLSRRKEERMAAEQIEKLRVKTDSASNPTLSLSGGNQQKVVLAKWLATNPRILILDEPTRGVDVGAKYEIYSIMKNLARRGVTIIMISSDLPEIVGMSDRVYVMYEGSLAGELTKDHINEQSIMQLASGSIRQ